MLKAVIIQRVPISDSPVPEATIADLHARLSAFHANLPPSLSLGRMLVLGSDDAMYHLRPLLCYAHLFYLSAMMLFARRLIMIHVDLRPKGSADMSPMISQVIEEGYIAAQTSVRILSLMLAEGRIVQVCWLCM